MDSIVQLPRTRSDFDATWSLLTAEQNGAFCSDNNNDDN